MHDSVMEWGKSVLTPDVVAGKRILEVGSMDFNGSLQPYIKSLNPKEFIGVDIEDGPGVDLVVNASNLLTTFGFDCWDVVVTTEMLEHCWDWQEAVFQMKRSLAPGGLLVLSTRSPGFPLHNHPADHWRFTVDVMGEVLWDLADVEIISDPAWPGVFATGRRSGRVSLPTVRAEGVDGSRWEEWVAPVKPEYEPREEAPAARTIFKGRNRDVAVVIASIPERRHMLPKAMESVYDQTIGPVETRIVIGMPRLQAYHAACDVDAEFVGWLDDDDYMMPDYLETLINGQRESGADMVYSRSAVRQPDGTDLIQGEDVPMEQHWNWDYIANAFIYRTSLIREIGGFPSARQSAWGAIHYEAMRLGAKFHFVDHDPILVINVHAGNLTNKEKLVEWNPQG